MTTGPDQHKPDDRLLEDFLAGKSEVSSAYRQSSAQVPESLDNAVLKMARDELASAPRRANGLRRWQWPLALAATLVLSFSVLLSMQGDREASKAMFDMAPPPAPLAAESAPAVETPAPKDERAEPVPAKARRPLAPTLVVRDAPATPQINAAEPSAPALKKQMAMQEQAAMAAEEYKAKELNESTQAARQKTEVDSARVDALERRSRASTAGAIAPAPAPAALAADASETPEHWLARIRVLRDAKNLDEARKQLREFLQAYPGYALPEDLKSLDEAARSSSTSK